MEGTLSFITGNDPLLAEELIWVLASLVRSFFSQRKEDNNESSYHDSPEDTGGTSEPGCPDPCTPVDDSTGASTSWRNQKTGLS